MRRKKEKVFYGYIITAAAWLLYFFITGSSSYGTSIVCTRMVLEQGWDQSIIGLSSSMLYLAVTLISVPVSMMAKKKGCRKTIIAGALVGIAAYGGLDLFAGSPVIYGAMFFLMGISSAACGMTIGPALITAWFKKKRGLNLSLFYTSGSIAGFVMPLVSQGLSNISVQLCWTVYFAEALCALLLGIFVVSDKPEYKNQTVDGLPAEQAAKESVDAAGAAEKLALKSGPSLSDCYHSLRFYSLFFQTFVYRLMHTGIISYIAIYAVERGVDFAIAAVLVTIYSTSNFLGRFLVGASSKFSVSWKAVNIAAFILMSIGAVLLPFAATYPLIVFCVLMMGIGQGLAFTIFPILVSDCFGDQNFMVLNGVYSTLGTAGSVFSPVILLAVANQTGVYEMAYLLIAILVVAAFILAIATPIRMVKIHRVVPKEQGDASIL